MAFLNGTAAADQLAGGIADDRLSARSGGDLVQGGGGRDVISGGEGSDTLLGGAGDDVIFGFGSSDRLAGSGDIIATRVASGFDAPVFSASAPGDPDRLYVVEKTGQIRILDPATGTVNSANFLTVPQNQIETSGEQGLLGLAFHPNYVTNGQFYVYMTNAAGDIEVRRYTRDTANPDQASAASGDVILTVPHPGNSNHNGGWISFGPDGYLYIATGDGGAAGDPPNNAQNVNSLLGKMLRIDVNSDGFPGDPSRDYAIPSDNPFAAGAGADEIWAVGLRNPWRPSFDRVTGDLYIADVGQDRYEEVNFQAAGTAGGLNYGWKVMEGLNIYDGTIPGNPAPGSSVLTDPVTAYPHAANETGGFSVTGGYVYRGPSEGMQGSYLYADFVTNQLWSFRMVNSAAVDAANRTGQLVEVGGRVDQIASFGEDGHGNLYIVGLDGEIFRLDPQIGAGDGTDSIDGGSGNDQIHGGAGGDILLGGVGDDALFGGGQDDLIVGGAGRDHLTGGAGADRFDFNRATDSGPGAARDVVVDLTARQDVIDLSGIDASTGRGGNQDFVYVGTAVFSAEGQVRLMQSGSSVLVQMNLTGTGGAEAQIVLRDALVTDFSLADFLF